MMSRLAGNDLLLVALSFAWIVLVIAVGEITRRVGNYPGDLTRKVIHIGVGMWALPTALLFHSSFWAAFCPLVFILLNAVSYRLRLMEVIEEGGRGSPGTIYFPLSFALLILVLWPLGGRAASVAGLYAMGFGDAAASIVGRRWGRHRYRLGPVVKSWEGTGALLAAAFVFILLGTWPVLGHPAPAASALAAVTAGAAEAPAGRGLDNLTVPIAAALVFLVLQGGGG